MNILIKAIDHCKFTIPLQVLDVAFRDDVHNWRQAPISLDERISAAVFKPRVLVDADLVGGEVVIIDLAGLPNKYLDNYSTIYEIPSDRVMHRTIMSVLSIGYLPLSASYAGVMNGGSMGGTGNDVTSAAMRVGSSMSTMPTVSTASADIIGYNTVLLRNTVGIAGTYQLRCVVGNEEFLNNISPRSYLAFAKLCEYAVKSYIYNKLIVAIDTAYLSGGQELGSIKNIIESYSDAEENYQTYLREVWQSTAFMNDSKTYERHIKMMISPGL